MTIKTNDELLKLIEHEDALLVYFSHETCGVCKVLKPKVIDLLKKKYPKLKMFDVDTIKTPDIPAQNNIFVVPTLLVYFAGREYIRKVRQFGIEELDVLIERPYGMIFQ